MRPLVRRLKRPGIRAQVLLGFTAFTALIVALLWFFQIGLLNTFYKAIKTNEIRAVSNRVVEMLDSGASMADFIEITYSANVSILLADKNGTNISVSPNARGSVLERFDTIDCRMLFLEAKAAGGSVLEDNLEQAAGDIGAGILYAQIVTLSDGGEYLVLLNSSVVPVDSTVETLKVQLWCLTAVMLLLALVLALFIAARLSKPIERINDSAKHLAQGNYAIRFPESGAREVAELAGTLNYAAAELSKVEDLRRELIANVSHDLRTPLTMISGYAEVMRDIPGENTPENVQVIIDESNRLADLVNDLLDLSKLQSGTQKLAPAVFCLTEDIKKRCTATISWPATVSRLALTARCTSAPTACASRRCSITS